MLNNYPNMQGPRVKKFASSWRPHVSINSDKLELSLRHNAAVMRTDADLSVQRLLCTLYISF